MDIEIFCICDHALFGDGKLSIIGVFDSFGSDVFPVVHSRFFIVTKIRLEHAESGEHLIGYALRNQETNISQQLIELPQVKEIGVGQTGSISTVFEIERFTITKPGGLYIDLLFDKRIVKSLPITILEVPK